MEGVVRLAEGRAFVLRLQRLLVELGLVSESMYHSWEGWHSSSSVKKLLCAMTHPQVIAVHFIICSISGFREPGVSDCQSYLVLRVLLNCWAGFALMPI